MVWVTSLIDVPAPGTNFHPLSRIVELALERPEKSGPDHLYDPTTAPNQLWQTDFTYFKIKNRGWHYRSTVPDDY